MKKKFMIPKGNFGYMQNRRLLTVLYTILLFCISITLYFAGIKSTGSNKNLLTIVAILGCLPASKSAVNMIMFSRYKGCSASIKEQLNRNYSNLHTLYDMVFTSYEKNYEIHHMCMNNKVLCAYTSNEKCDAAACEKHLENMLTQNGHQNITVKVFKDFAKYKNRLEQLDSLAELGRTADEIRQLLLEISL